MPEKPAANAARNGAGGNGAEADTASDAATVQAIRFSSRAAAPPDPAAAVGKLLRDPSLRNNERGKGMLRLLHVNAVGAEQLPDVAAAVPAALRRHRRATRPPVRGDVAGLRPGTRRAGADHRPAGGHALSAATTATAQPPATGGYP